MKKILTSRNVWLGLASTLSFVAVTVVQPASVFFIFKGETPEELLK